MANAVLAAARKQVVDDWRRAHQSLARYLALVEDGDISDVHKELANSSAAPGPSFTAVSANGRKRAAAAAETDEEEVPKKKGRKSGPKKEKDPNAPKRPASAYILFQNAVRDEMRGAHPDLDYRDLTKQIGERWKALSEEDKKPWSDAGSRAMDGFKEARKAYEAAHPDLVEAAKVARTSSAAVADGEKPKKKRGRPSKADLEAKKALAGEPAAPTTTKKTAPLSAAVIASDDDDDDESSESSEETSDDSDEAEAPAVVQKKSLTAPVASSADSSDEESDSSDEPAPPKRSAPAPAPAPAAATPSKHKAGKTKSSEKKARK